MLGTAMSDHAREGLLNAFVVTSVIRDQDPLERTPTSDPYGDRGSEKIRVRKHIMRAWIARADSIGAGYRVEDRGTPSMNAEKMCEVIGVTLTPAQIDACRYLECCGFRFCVDFGYENACEKAATHWLTDDATTATVH